MLFGMSYQTVVLDEQTIKPIQFIFLICGKRGTMKKLLQLLLVVLPLFATGQKKLAEKVNTLLREGVTFTTHDLFGQATPNENYRNQLKEYACFDLHPEIFGRIKTEHPEYVSLSFPFRGTELTVLLVRANPLTNGFVIETDNGLYQGYEAGVYYRGIIQGDEESLAVLNFSGSECSGVVSSAALGNINLGRLKSAGNQTAYIAYSDRDALFDMSLRCGTPNQNTQELPAPRYLRGTEQTTHCVKFYYELAFDLYTDLGSDVTAATDWAIGLHNIVSAIYENDGIDQTPLSEVFVWTIPDPYYFMYSSILYSFPVLRPAFNGDLAILFKGAGNGGYAIEVGSLCESGNISGPYCTTGYNLDVQDIPIFSFDVLATAHETGHVLGSQHTHQCVWNGNNTAIDNCGAAYNGGEGLACLDPDNPIIPESGTGTIMSYCQQALAAGFGPQPSQRIIDYIESSACLGSDCVVSCTSTLQGIDVFRIGNNQALVYISDSNPDASQWLFRIMPNDFYVVTEKSFVISGLPNGDNVALQVRQICDDPYSATFTKGVYVASTDANPVPVCGSTITEYDMDTTSPIQILYPDEPGQAVTLHFDFIECSTTMVRIFDGIGPWGEPAVTYYGTPTDIPDFTATNPTGAVTVLYGGLGDFSEGYQAQISCTQLGTPDTLKADLAIYPNPVSETLTIESTFPLGEIRFIDVSGRHVLNSRTRESRLDINTSGWATGTYILQIGSDGEKHLFKVIKK